MCSNPLNPALADSRVMLADGKQKSFKNFLGIERPYYYPTPGNSFGRVIREVFRTEMSEFGQDGLYIDEYSYGNRIINMEGVPDWDGCSVIIDPKTNEVIRKVANLALITRAMRTEFNQAVLSGAKELWTNWEPTTEADTALNIPHFLEYVREDDWPRGDLASPLGCAGADAKTNADVMKELCRILQYGLLYVHIGNSAYAETTPSIFGDIYPITPTELHAGYIIGQERIITARSGRFGFNDAAPLAAMVYDRNGLRKTDGARFVTEGGKTFCAFDLHEGEIGIARRREAKD